MKIRELKFNDVYAAAKILKKLDIQVTEKEMKMEDGMVKGITIIKNTLAEVGNAQEEINNFLGSLFNITSEEFGNLTIEQSIDAFNQIKNTKGIGTFLNSLKNLMK